MKEQDRNLYYLHELTDYKVADDYCDVRGWKVKDANDRIIGTVDNLLVDKRDKRVVYIDVEVDKSIIENDYETFNASAAEGVHGFVNKEGDDHLIIPVEMAVLDEDNKIVTTNEIDHQTFASTRRFSKGTPIAPEFELLLLEKYITYKNPRSSN